MKLRTAVVALASALLHLCTLPALAEQGYTQASEDGSAFNARFPNAHRDWDNIAKFEINPALRTLFSNSYGSSCSAIANPYPYQWCVDGTQRTISVYTQPQAGGAFSWRTAFTINADGTLNQATIANGTVVGAMLAPGAAVQNIGFNPVQSVAGRAGNVVLTASDITDGTTAGRTLFTAASAAAQKSALAIAAGDVSGLAASATTNTTNANNITSGTLALARLPSIPTTSVTGLASSATTDTTNASNITSGTLALARLPSIPTTSVTGLASSATTDTTNANNITSGTLALARLPTPFSLSGSAAFGSPLLQTITTEAQTAGTNFVLANVLQATRTGGSGHREALSVIQNSSTASPGEFVVGGQATGHATAGSGLVFGWNPYCLIESGVATTVQCTGEESDTDIRNTSVVNKTGIQIVDVSTSTGFGTTLDAGLAILNQTGGRGYGNAIQIGTGIANPGVANGGSILVAAGGNVTNGIDLSRLGGVNGIITGNAWLSPGALIGGVGDATFRTVKGGIFTVAALPVCNSGAQGTRAGVTDATSPTFLGTLTGGGAVHTPVYCNGTAWVPG